MENEWRDVNAIRIQLCWQQYQWRKLLRQDEELFPEGLVKTPSEYSSFSPSSGASGARSDRSSPGNERQGQSSRVLLNTSETGSSPGDSGPGKIVLPVADQAMDRRGNHTSPIAPPSPPKPEDQTIPQAAHLPHYTSGGVRDVEKRDTDGDVNSQPTVLQSPPCILSAAPILDPPSVPSTPRRLQESPPPAEDVNGHPDRRVHNAIEAADGTTTTSDPTTLTQAQPAVADIPSDQPSTSQAGCPHTDDGISSRPRWQAQPAEAQTQPAVTNIASDRPSPSQHGAPSTNDGISSCLESNPPLNLSNDYLAQKQDYAHAAPVPSSLTRHRSKEIEVLPTSRDEYTRSSHEDLRPSGAVVPSEPRATRTSSQADDGSAVTTGNSVQPSTLPTQPIPRPPLGRLEQKGGVQGNRPSEPISALEARNRRTKLSQQAKPVPQKAKGKRPIVLRGFEEKKLGAAKNKPVQMSDPDPEESTAVPVEDAKDTARQKPTANPNPTRKPSRAFEGASASSQAPPTQDVDAGPDSAAPEEEADFFKEFLKNQAVRWAAANQDRKAAAAAAQKREKRGR